MKGKYAPIFVLLPIFLLVLYVYWSVFFKNVLVSQSVTEIPLGSTIQLDEEIKPTESLAIFHFFDPSCLIAQDNIEHLKILVDRFNGREASWYIVSNKAIDSKAFEKKLGFHATWIVDSDGELATNLGVISTPMLVIVEDHTLYFRGTYLKNGSFCGADNITSSDAGVALRSIMKGNQLPLYLKDVKTYIGCTL